ncbi:MAG: serine hydrolase, partial [Candidatus Eisenbacteria bacterium]
PPGLRWAYKDSDAILMGWVLGRATGHTVAEQLEQGIWRPMGAEYDASWDLDHANGHENTASGLNATARDLARLGRLVLQGGAREGAQILPRDWVAASTTLDRSRTEPEVSTWWRMQHQHYWWIPMQNWDAEGDCFADGSRGQRIYLHPRSPRQRERPGLPVPQAGPRPPGRALSVSGRDPGPADGRGHGRGGPGLGAAALSGLVRAGRGRPLGTGHHRVGDARRRPAAAREARDGGGGGGRP